MIALGLLGLLLGAPSPLGAPEARAAKLLDSRESVLDALDKVDRAIAAVQQELATLQVEREELGATADELRLEAARLDAQLAARRQALRTRLRARAVSKGAAELRLLLGADSVTDLVRRHRALGHVLEHDARMLRSLEDAQAAAHAARRRHEAAMARVEGLAGQARQRRDALEAERETKGALLRKVQEERRLMRAAAREQAARSVELGATVAALRPAPAPPSAARPAPQPAGQPRVDGAAFEAARGHLPRPVKGKLVGRFGPRTDPALGARTFVKGWEFDAPLGTPVRAVFDGAVVHAGWYKGYGNLVIVHHGAGYFSLYGHLASLSRARGERVGAGEVVGEVGETGSLRGPMLYFELRKESRALDPARWLR